MACSLLSFLALIHAGIPLNAQGNPGTNLSVRLEVVSVTRVGDTSQVSYVAHNSPTSQERLWALTIETPAEPLRISRPEPADSWLVLTRYKDRPVVEWSSLTGTMALPGASTPALSFKATGLPVIVDAYVEGYYPIPNIDSLTDEQVLTQDSLELHSVRIKTVGIGPTEPGATPTRRTAHLASLTTASCTLGWIASSAVCRRLEEKLQQASQALARGDNDTARTRLRSFLSALETQHDAHGTLPVKGNAYWLLKVNAEYILGLAAPF